MSGISSTGPWSGRYAPREKQQAVRIVRALRGELGTSRGTIKRIAEQTRYGIGRAQVARSMRQVDTRGVNRSRTSPLGQTSLTSVPSPMHSYA